MKKTIVVLVGLIFLIQLSVAAHYIVGYVNNSYTAVQANGKTITLWNPLIGTSDNLTDIIGPTGNSGTNNIYLIDCELLQNGCNVGDILSVKVFNDGTDNLTQTTNISVTGAGFDQAQDLRINSPPQVNLVTPINTFNTSNQVTFNCSITDQDDNIANISLWTNTTGSWTINETKLASPGETYKIFTKNISEGSYQWTCSLQDNLSIERFASENRSFFIDKNPPIISSIEVNQTQLCASYQVRVNCSTTDAFLGIHTVLIQSISPNQTRTNYTASLLTGDTYYADIAIATKGDWQFNCVVNDSAGNQNNQTSNTLQVDPNEAELIINQSRIYYNETPKLEFQNIQITANISNIGCLDATNLQVGFYNGNKDSGGIALENVTDTIIGLSTANISINFSKGIGLENIFIYADINNLFSELNESNNQGNISIYLQSWEKMYGNTSIDKILSNKANSNITFWLNHSNIQGNIFIADSESDINWYALRALGRTTTNTTASNDFSDLDTLLGMDTVNDSVYTTFTNTGTPKEEANFSFFKSQAYFVPTINSSEGNNNFVTGILWDTSDDTNNEFDQIEKEDIVFIAKVNKESVGAYGTYDYEARIPSKLREYDPTDSQEIFFYYEIN